MGAGWNEREGAFHRTVTSSHLVRLFSPRHSLLARVNQCDSEPASGCPTIKSHFELARAPIHYRAIDGINDSIRGPSNLMIPYA